MRNETLAILKNTDLRLATHSTSKSGSSKGKILFSGKKALEVFLVTAKKLALVAKSEGAKEGEKIAVSFAAPTEKALRLAIRIAKGKGEISIFNGKLAKSYRLGLTEKEIARDEKSGLAFNEALKAKNEESEKAEAKPEGTPEAEKKADSTPKKAVKKGK